MRTTLTKVVLALAMATASPASAIAADQPTEPSSCVRTQSIDDWKPVDKSTIIVRTGPDHSYKVTFASRCSHMKSSVFARVETRPTTAIACLSRGDIVLFGRGPRRADNSFEREERCVVKSVEPIETTKDAPPPS